MHGEHLLFVIVLCKGVCHIAKKFSIKQGLEMWIFLPLTELTRDPRILILVLLCGWDAFRHRHRPWYWWVLSCQRNLDINWLVAILCSQSFRFLIALAWLALCVYNIDILISKPWFGSWFLFSYSFRRKNKGFPAFLTRCHLLPHWEEILRIH